MTGLSCDCPGFIHNQRCTHRALLLERLGWLPAVEPEMPYVDASPVDCPDCSGCGLQTFRSFEERCTTCNGSGGSAEPPPARRAAADGGCCLKRTNCPISGRSPDRPSLRKETRMHPTCDPALPVVEATPGLVRATFGEHAVVIWPSGVGRFHVEIHSADQLAARDPADDWPVPLAEVELMAR